MDDLSLLVQEHPIRAPLINTPPGAGKWVALWLALMLVGFFGLLRYSSLPGQPASAPQRWPTESMLARTPDQLTLVIFLHPQCACTRASLRELERLMRHAAGRMTAYAILVDPFSYDNRQASTAIEDLARAIPGVVLSREEGGREARLFRAYTSGQVLVYDAHGGLLFEGGITGSRGHEGESAGRTAIEALLDAQQSPATASAPVFGCGLGANP